MATKQDNQKQWYMATVLETCAAFEVPMKKGLTAAQVKERSQKSKRLLVPVIPRVSSLFWLVLAVMLVLSASSFVLESKHAVLVFTFSACLLGAFALTQQSFVRHVLLIAAKSPQKNVTVRREGTIIQIAAETVVPGDIFVLAPGDYVAANVRLLETKDLFVDESTSTGQDVPEQKNTFTLHKKTKTQSQKNMIAAGSYIHSGQGIGIAVGYPITSEQTVEIPKSHVTIVQQRRHAVVTMCVFLLGLTIAFFGVSIFAVIALSALLALATHYYAGYWLQYVTWASLFDQAAISGLKFKDFKKLKDFAKVDFVFVDVPSDYIEIAAFIHELQAELRIEVRPLVKKSEVKPIEAELNIKDSALTYKMFMEATRAKKIKLLSEYQLLVGFDAVAVSEAISIMQQAGHHAVWIDETDTPQQGAAITDLYISLNKSPSPFLQTKSDIQFVRQGSLKKIAFFFDAKTKFKNITAY